MSTPTTDEPRVLEPRISKREFVQRSARRAGIPVRKMQEAYDAIVDELLDLVGQGHRVTLTGFGRFHTQKHKGHVAQTEIRKGVKAPSGKQTTVDDYMVLKFSATREVNRRFPLRKDD